MDSWDNMLSKGPEGKGVQDWLVQHTLQVYGYKIYSEKVLELLVPSVCLVCEPVWGEITVETRIQETQNGRSDPTVSLGCPSRVPREICW